MRGVAILMVLLDHLALGGLSSAGSVGVTLFFTLSGFLITSLMLEEHAAAGKVNLRAFYLRRARRLLPALVVFLGAMLVGGWLIGPGAATLTDVLLALSYFGNWFSAAGFTLHGLTHTWSLAVEEQFYIVWPVLFVLLARRKQLRTPLLWVAGVGSVGFAVVRALEWDGGRGGRWVYFATESRADALLIGCLAAAWLHRSRDREASPKLATLAVVALVPLFFTTDFSRAVVLPTIVPIVAAFLIIWVVRGNYSGWLTTPWLMYVGQRSYALYLWNFPVLWIGVALMPGLRGVNTVILLAVSWGLTWLSWKYVERPFLARRHTPAPVPLSEGNDDRGSSTPTESERPDPLAASAPA